jgi:hypothetical protein
MDYIRGAGEALGTTKQHPHRLKYYNYNSSMRVAMSSIFKILEEYKSIGHFKYHHRKRNQR